MSGPSRRRHIALAGLLLGVALGVLLLGLNPAALAPASAARLLVGGALLGLVASLPFLLWPDRTAAQGPSRPFWVAVSASALLYALLVESQRLLYYAYLVNGVRRLLVAATVAAAVVALLTALAAIRPPRGSASGRLLAVSIGLLAIAPFAARRQEGPSLGPAPEPLRATTSRSVLVVGLEGVSWELLSAWASDGSLPTFARLMREGVSGPLESPAPYDRAALWTTAATGKRPAKHGVVAGTRQLTPLGPLDLLPRPFGLPAPSRLPLSRAEPLAGSQRRSLAFWEVLARRGHEAAVLNWPAADPPRDGLLVWATERLFAGVETPLAGLPPEQAARAALFRLDPGTLERSLASTLVPRDLPAEDADATTPLAGAARDLSVAGAALASVPVTPRSVSALVLTGLAPVARRLAPAVAAGPRYWGLPPREPEPRARVLLAYYRFLDEVLADLVHREGRERTICLFSPVGWGPPPPAVAVTRFLLGREPEAGPQASPSGFLILAGEGIRSAARLTSASVPDLAPTVLVLAGEPIARDIDGRVLAEAFDERFARASLPIVTTFEPGGPQ